MKNKDSNLIKRIGKGFGLFLGGVLLATTPVGCSKKFVEKVCKEKKEFHKKYNLNDIMANEFIEGLSKHRKNNRRYLDASSMEGHIFSGDHGIFVNSSHMGPGIFHDEKTDEHISYCLGEVSIYAGKRAENEFHDLYKDSPVLNRIPIFFDAIDKEASNIDNIDLKISLSKENRVQKMDITYRNLENELVREDFSDVKEIMKYAEEVRENFTVSVNPENKEEINNFLESSSNLVKFSEKYIKENRLNKQNVEVTSKNTEEPEYSPYINPNIDDIDKWLDNWGFGTREELSKQLAKQLYDSEVFKNQESGSVYEGCYYDYNTFSGNEGLFIQGKYMHNLASAHGGFHSGNLTKITFGEDVEEAFNKIIRNDPVLKDAPLRYFTNKYKDSDIRSVTITDWDIEDETVNEIEIEYKNGNKVNIEKKDSFPKFFINDQGVFDGNWYDFSKIFFEQALKIEKEDNYPYKEEASWDTPTYFNYDFSTEYIEACSDLVKKLNGL